LGRDFDVKIEDFEARWYGHSDNDVDVTVLPLGPIIQQIDGTENRVFFRSIADALIPTEEQLAALDAIEEVVFIGYPNGMFDAKNLTPIVRRGITATPVQLDYNGQPTFLVDGSVFPGSSGSPVLIANTGGYAARGGFVVGVRVHLLGLVASVAIRQEQGTISFVSIPTATAPVVTSQQMIDLGIVYKARTIREAAREFLTRAGVL
jgi:V8-like Glu-specific endopeptidase